MQRAILVLLMFGTCTVFGADWRQFRGPGGLGASDEKGLPAEWSATQNIVWKTPLPGPGTSSPVTVGDRVYVTCYTGYAIDKKDPGDMANLKRHVVCVSRKDGKTLWTKEFEPILAEHKYAGEGSYHGYAASTPAIEKDRLYVFFGKSGVYCLDLDGKQIWHTPVGKGTSGWGSGASPLVYKDLLIINASVESQSMIAFDKLTGKEIWRAPKIGSAWNTPMIVTTPDKQDELVISVQGRVLGIDPANGKELWFADGVKSYVCPSVVQHKGVIYAIGGGSTSIAIRPGGRGNVSETHVVWRKTKGSNCSSPVYHDGYLYYSSTGGGVVTCQDVATGETMYQERLKPNAGTFYSSPTLADGKLYFPSQHDGTFVIAPGPKFKLLAHNTFADDKSRTNASVAVSDGRLFMRTDQNLYCIGTR